MNNKKILYCVLNWGLGHASRSIPLIHQLLLKNNTVSIATDGIALDFLKIEFPDLTFLELPSYNIQYPNRRIMISLANQFPHIFRNYLKEKKLIDSLVLEKEIEVIISDCRYSCHSSHTQNYIITHQIQLHTGNKWMNKLATRLNYYFLKKFDEVWIPDTKERELSGNLSKSKPSLKTKFIGALSRFTFFETEKDIDILCLLSGPEPARTNFENKLFLQLKEIRSAKIVLVRGSNLQRTESKEEYGVYDLLNTSALEQLILKSKIIVCRSGYSTILDLKATKSKAILIPTPGQPEQEYLATYLMDQGFFYQVDQADLKLKEDIIKAANYPGFKYI